MAQPGEYAKRAFLNKKFDLTAAEGLADLIDAETELQHEQANNQFHGILEAQCNLWRKQLLKISTLIEAYINFPEEDIPEAVITEVDDIKNQVSSSIQKTLQDNNRGEMLRHGIKVGIFGAPNVGKSTLINLITRRQVAIVSNIPGTTRDVIESKIDVDGYPIIFHDTAGMREIFSNNSHNIIEQQGIKIAQQLSENVNIKLILFDITQSPDKTAMTLIDQNSIIVLNKTDAIQKEDINTWMKNLPNTINRSKIVPISCVKNCNIDKLITTLITCIKQDIPTNTPSYITRMRHRNNLTKAYDTLTIAKVDKEDIAIFAEDIRMASRHLESLIGIIDADEILGEIFARFCIGK